MPASSTVCATGRNKQADTARSYGKLQAVFRYRNLAARTQPSRERGSSFLEVLGHRIRFGKGRLFRRIPMEAHRSRCNSHSHENVRRGYFSRSKRGVLRRALEEKSLD